MPNPYFNSLNNQQNGIDQMLNEINNFRNNFKGDPRAEVEKMLKTGVYGFSIARAVISGNLAFNISDF